MIDSLKLLVQRDQVRTIFANPIWMKCARARLRPKHVISWGIITIAITAFACLLVYFNAREEDLTPMAAARAMMFPVVIIQGGIMMLLGTGSVSSGVSQEREDRMLDYQRMTPMSPTGKIIGYLFGLPVREYVLFLMTMPFLGFCIVKGELEIGTILHFYAVFFTSVLLYHMTGLVVGMVSSKPRRASIMAQGFVLLLYLVLPNLTFVGMDFFRYLTAVPTFTHLVLEQIQVAQNMSPEAFREAAWVPPDAEPFFETTLHYSAYTLMVQAFLLTAMYTVVRRKWIDEFRHPFSKLEASIFFSGVLIFLMGSVWPRVANVDAMREFLSQLPRQYHDDPPVIAVNLILFVWAIVVGMIAIFVMHVITPSRETMLKEWRRAKKYGRTTAPWRSDGASSLPVTIFIVASSLLAGTMVIRHILVAGQVFQHVPSLEICLAPIVIFACVIFFIQGVRERYGLRATLLGVFLLWMLPVFTAVVMGTAWRPTLVAESWLVALPFPPTMAWVSISHFMEQAVAIDGQHVPLVPDDVHPNIKSMITFSLAGYGALAVFMQVSLFRWRRRLWNRVFNPDDGDMTEQVEKELERPAFAGAIATTPHDPESE